MNHDEDKLTTQQEAQNETINKEQSAQSQSTEETSSNEPHQDENVNNTNTEKTWHNKSVIKRGIAMLGYSFVAGFVRLAITLIAIFQFLSLLFSEKPNQPLVKFGQNLNTYQYQINQFLTVNSEMYPFPFADWPDSASK